MNEFLKLQKDFERLVKQKENKIIRNYANGYKRLRRDLSKIYDKYEKDGEVDYYKFQKYDIKLFDIETAAILRSIYKDNDSLIRETLNEVIDYTEKKSIEAVGANYLIKNVSRSFDTEKLINEQVAGKIWTQRTKRYGDSFVRDMHTVIKSGLKNGDTYTTMANNLKDRFGKDLKNITTIARTEAARVQEFTKFETMRAINKKVDLVKTWKTMSDERVRDSHMSMDGVSVRFDEEFVLPSGATCLYPKSSGDPAEDINCRCYLEYNVDDGSYDLDDVKDSEYGEDNEGIKLEFKEFHSFVDFEEFMGDILWDFDDSITEEEELIIGEYTYGTDALINNSLRSGIVNEEINERIQVLDNVLTRFELVDNIKVFRGTNVSFLRELFNEDDPLLFKGKTFTEEGYMSTSVLKKSVFREKEAIFEINIPKGKGSGASICNFSRIFDEYEFLINRGHEFKIVNVEYKYVEEFEHEYYYFLLELI